MKKFNKKIALILSLIFCFSCSLIAYADEIKLELPEVNADINVSSDATVIKTGVSADDDVWGDTPKDQVAETILAMKEMYAEYLIIDNVAGKDIRVFISDKVSEDTMNYFNLQLLSDEQMEKFLEQYNSGDETLSSTAKEIMFGDIPFVEVFFDGQTEEGSNADGYILFTIINGHSVSINLDVCDDITDDIKDYIKNMAGNINFTHIEEKAMDPNSTISPYATFFFLVLLILLAGSVIATITINRKRKKADRIYAANLANYRQDREEGFEKTQEVLFSNNTEIFDYVIDSYAKFQCFINKPLPYIASIATVILCILFAVTVNSEWWMTLVFVIILGFIIYKFATSSITMSKSLKKVYGKIKSKNATYNFYDREIQICGIESNEFHPYFQITEIAEHKGYLYFYFGDFNPYFMDVTKFTVGEYEEFKKFIVKKTRRKIK